MMYVYAIAGFVMLFGGGDWLVRGAVSVSRRLGLSPLLIGMTVVAFCTSAPELVVSLDAALGGNSDIALGNVVGSNIFNVLVVLGIATLVSPIVVRPVELRRDTVVMVGSALVLAVICQFGVINRVEGALLFVSLVIYVVLSYRAELQDPHAPSPGLNVQRPAEEKSPLPLWAGLGLLAAGLALLVVGSRLLIVGATDIARMLGISEAVIGLTLVAAGTSLPEVATSLTAAKQGHADVAVGNVVGSDIFNILCIVGVTSIVKPIKVAEEIARFDVWFMLALCVLLGSLLLLRGRAGRIVGACFLVGYAAYSALLLGGILG